MSTYSRTEVLGRVGQTPELKHGKNGNAYVRFSVAVDRFGGRDEAGVVQKTTQWHNCAAFGKNAEFIANHVKVGELLFVVGETVTEEYEGKERSSLMVSTVVKTHWDSADQENKAEGTMQAGASSKSASAKPASKSTSTDEDVPF